MYKYSPRGPNHPYVRVLLSQSFQFASAPILILCILICHSTSPSFVSTPQRNISAAPLHSTTAYEYSHSPPNCWTQLGLFTASHLHLLKIVGVQPCFDSSPFSHYDLNFSTWPLPTQSRPNSSPNQTISASSPLGFPVDRYSNPPSPPLMPLRSFTASQSHTLQGTMPFSDTFLRANQASTPPPQH